MLIASSAMKIAASTRNNYKRNHITTYQILCTRRTPATVKKSIGLPASPQLSGFLHSHFDNCTLIRNISTVYLDYSIWTVASGREIARPSTGTLQKHMPTPTPRLRRGRLPETPHTTGPVSTNTVHII